MHPSLIRSVVDLILRSTGLPLVSTPFLLLLSAQNLTCCHVGGREYMFFCGAALSVAAARPSLRSFLISGMSS